MSTPGDRTAAHLDWLRRHPEAFEPGLRWFDPAPAPVRNVGAVAAGPDALGQPVVLLHCAAGAPDPAGAMLDAAAALRAEADGLAAWFARPHAPRLMLVARELEPAARARLGLLGPALGLRLWLMTGEEERPRLSALLPARLQRPLAEAPPAPVGSQRALRRLLQATMQIRPELEVLGAGWPLVIAGARGPCAAVHRDGDDLLFVTERAARRVEVLRLDDEEAVDRALDALMREQYALAR